MRDHTGDIRGYHRTSKAYYAKDYDVISVNFGLFCEEGGTSGEMTMEWEEIGSRELVPILKCFSDGWSALNQFSDLITELAKNDSKNITEEEFCSILDSLNFKDLTQYEYPDSLKSESIPVENSELFEVLQDVVENFSEYEKEYGTSKCESILRAKEILKRK